MQCLSHWLLHGLQDPRKPPVSEPSASGTAPVHSTGPSIFLSRSHKSVRTVPALLTAAAVALMASFGGASVPQLAPGSYNVKRVPYLQSTGQNLPVPPSGTRWSSVVVDSGCSVSVFDSADKFRALYPSKTYLQTADKSQRIFDQRGTVVLPAVDHHGAYRPLVVKHAICGPGFHNLLSVSDVLESYPNGQVVFNNSNPFIEVQPGVRIPIQRSGRLFYLTPVNAAPSHGQRFEAFMNSEIVPADYDVGTEMAILPPTMSPVDPSAVPFPSTATLVHERFGHLSDDVLRDSRNMASSLPCSSSGGVQCPICALSKQRRQDVVHRPAPRVRRVAPRSVQCPSVRRFAWTLRYPGRPRSALRRCLCRFVLPVHMGAMHSLQIRCCRLSSSVLCRGRSAARDCH